MDDKHVKAARLAQLLTKIRDGLQQSFLSSAADSPRLTLDQTDDELPNILGIKLDIATAALYLRDLDLPHDGLRLDGEWNGLVNRAVGECLATAADGKSEEYREQLTALFGPFPVHGNPNDPIVGDRRAMLDGHVSQILEHVNELLPRIKAMQNKGEENGGADSPPKHKKRKTRKTRKKRSDPKADKVLADAYHNGGYATEADFAAKVGLTEIAVHRARDRHRKRQEAKKKARRK